MAGRVAYYGNIVKDGLVLDLDAAKRDSYPTTGTVWRDISGNQNNGTLTNGPTFSSANYGSIVFDGVNDYVGSNTNINTGQDFTATAWINPALLGSTRCAIVSNSYNSTSRNGWYLCTAGGNTNNTFFFSVGNDASYRIASANTLTLNQWVNVTAVCTSGGNIVLYKNGTETTYAASSLTTGTVTYTSTQLNIGYRFVGGQSDPFKGNIAQVTVYNRALSAAEVLQNYNATKQRYGL